MAVASSRRPSPRPGPIAPPQTLTAELQQSIDQTLALVDLEATGGRQPVVDLEERAGGLLASLLPRARPALVAAAEQVAPEEPANMAATDVVTRLSTSGGRHWGISVGRYGSRNQAERILLQTALLELGTLDEALRKVVERKGGYDANFVGLSEEQAALACRRLSARNMDCASFGPG